MLKSFSWLTIGLSILLFPALAGALDLTKNEQAWLDNHPVIKAAPDPHFPPVEYFDENKRFKGMSAEYVSLLEKIIGIEFQIKAYPSWSMVLEKAKQGEIDLITAGALTEKRSSFLTGTTPHLTFPGVIITRKSFKKKFALTYPEFETLSLKNFTRKKVAIVMGYVWQEYVRRDHPDVIIVPVPDILSGLKLVADKTIDAMVVTLPMALYYVEKQGIPNLCIAGKTGYETRLSFLIRKELPQLRSIIDKALLTIPAPKKETIFKRWINLATPPFYKSWQFGVFLIVFAAALLSLVVILFWNKKLKAEVAKKTRTLEMDIEKREQVEARLKQNQARFTEFVDDLPVGIFRVTPDMPGKFLLLNRAMAEIFGFDSKEEVKNKTVAEFYADPRQRKELVRQLVKDGQAETEINFKKQNGSSIWCRVNIKTVFDDHGTPLFFDGTLQDLSRIKALEDNLRQSQKLEGIGQLAGGVAHDFNNILSSIIGYSQLLLMDFKDDSGAASKVKKILESAERAGNLVRQLLAFSRKEMVIPRVIEPGKLVNNLYKMLARLIGENIEFSVDIQEDIEHIKIDPGQLEQIIINLVVNARDAVNEAGGQNEKPMITITVANCHDKTSKTPCVEFRIQDTGIGMDRDTRQKIFDPFYTTKEVGKGTGLGLATVYGIVKHNKGEINVTAEPGKGSCFSICFPAVQERIKKDHFESMADQELPLQGNGRTILVAEDDRYIMEMLVKALTEKGYRVISAENGKAALKKAKTAEQLDLLVTDITMPEMDGTALALEVKTLFPQSEVIFMSGYPANEFVQDNSLLHAENFLHKPVSIKALFAMMKKIFQQS
ncbi:MAG: transporter substrate-binding domain-containing protein [Desulfobacteraceae bacterium]